MFESINLLGILVVLGAILVSMVLHELAHGYVAFWLGDDTAKEEGRLSLNVFRHLDPILSVLLPLVMYVTGGPIFGGAKPVPVDRYRLKYREWGMALVALAGPAMNFCLALVAFLIGHFTGGLYVGGLLSLAFVQFILTNLGFCIFNLLPIPPLDGSRVVYAIAPDGVREFMVTLEQYGLFVVLILVSFFGTALSGVMSGAMQGILKGFFWMVGVI